MKPELESLVVAYLEGALSEAEAARLTELLQANPDDLREFVALTQQERALEAMLEKGTRAESNLREVIDQLVAAREAPKVAREVVMRLARRTRRYRRAVSRPGWGFGLLAAGAMLIVIALAFVLRTGPEPVPGPRSPLVSHPPSPASQGEPVTAPPPLPARPEEPARPPTPAVPTPLPPPEPRTPPPSVESRRPAPPPTNPPRPEAPAPTVQRPASQPEQPKPLPERTIPAVARVEVVEGKVVAITPSGKVPLAAGQSIYPGQGLEAVRPDGRAVMVFGDGTVVEAGPGTVVPEVFEREAAKGGQGKRLSVTRGVIAADVAPQPQDQPMVIRTPHGQATVVGTTLRIVVDPDTKIGATRLEVDKGRVKFKNLAGKTVDVPSGHYAVAAVGMELAVRRETIAFRLEFDKPQALRPRIEVGTLVNLPTGPALRSASADKPGYTPGIAYWAGSEEVITFTVRKSTCLRFRYHLKEPASVTFIIKNLTKQENFTFQFQGMAGRWTTVTMPVFEIPVVTRGKAVSCEAEDKYGRFGFSAGPPDRPVEFMIDDFRVIEIER